MTVDFAALEARARKMDLAALHHALKDCREAERAMRGWNPEAEGRYADEGFTYADEIRRRNARK